MNLQFGRVFHLTGKGQAVAKEAREIANEARMCYAISLHPHIESPVVDLVVLTDKDYGTFLTPAVKTLPNFNPKIPDDLIAGALSDTPIDLNTILRDTLGKETLNAYAAQYYEKVKQAGKDATGEPIQEVSCEVLLYDANDRLIYMKNGHKVIEA